MNVCFPTTSTRFHDEVLLRRQMLVQRSCSKGQMFHLHHVTYKWFSNHLIPLHRCLRHSCQGRIPCQLCQVILLALGKTENRWHPPWWNCFDVQSGKFHLLHKMPENERIHVQGRRKGDYHESVSSPWKRGWAGCLRDFSNRSLHH